MIQPSNNIAMAQNAQPNLIAKRQLARSHIAMSSIIHSPTHPTRFGNRFHAISRAIFQPVTESYLIGFTVQDVFGLWFPRIWNSLERGRIHYNPNQDPNAAERSARSPNEQRRHALKENIKGLNWWNGFEETAREVQSGPGYLLVQSIFVAGATAWWLGRRSLMMSVKNLDTYTSHLNHVLQASPSPKNSAEAVSRLVTQMTRELSHDKLSTLSLSPTMSKAENSLLTQSEQHLQQWLGKHFQNQTSPVTFHDALKTWKKQYLKVLTDKTGLAKKSTDLRPVEKVFEELIVQWNGIKGITDPTKMTLFKLPKINSVVPGKVLQTSMDANQFLVNMEKFSTAIPELLKKLKTEKALTTSNRAITKVLTALRNTSVTNKFWVCVIATLLGGLNHFYVSAVAQSVARKYPANRLIPLPQTSVHHTNETGGPAHA